MVGCYDYTAPSVLFTDSKIYEGILELIRRGIKLRYLTQVIKDNLAYCKRMVDDGIEVRHLDGVKGNFAIIDKKFCSIYTVQVQMPTQMLITNSKSFVEQQQNFFDILWINAIPAEQRINELEREQKTKNEFVETISDQLKVKKVCEDLILSTKGYQEKICRLVQNQDSSRKVFFQLPSVSIYRLVTGGVNPKFIAAELIFTGGKIFLFLRALIRLFGLLLQTQIQNTRSPDVISWITLCISV